MSRPDDHSLTPTQLARVRKEAERALREAGALGKFPTPVADIMAVANVEEIEEDLDSGFIAKMRAKAGKSLKRALEKVRGLFHASAGLVFIDQTLAKVKQQFVRLHEAGHGFLPWQRPMYEVVEDCDQSLDAATAELFDREANTFASEVLFQLNTFRDLAEEKPFSIFTPVNLSKKFGASVYSSIRQYVSKNCRCCAVVVLNMPELVRGQGFRATLRRAIQSDTFTATFGQHPWKTVYTPDDDIGRLIPTGTRRASRPRSLVLVDQNGSRHECTAEAFTQRHQVFILVHVIGALTSTRVFMEL